MPYQTVWVKPQVLYRGCGVTVLAAYGDDDVDDPLDFWVVAIPRNEDLSAECDYRSVDLRDLGLGAFRTPKEKRAFIRQAVGDGRLQPVPR